MQGEGFLYKQPLCPTPEVAALQHQAWDSCINSPLCARDNGVGSRLGGLSPPGGAGVWRGDCLLMGTLLCSTMCLVFYFAFYTLSYAEALSIYCNFGLF